MEHQTLGRQVICSSEPAYYIVDCLIFELRNIKIATCLERNSLVEVQRWLMMKVFGIESSNHELHMQQGELRT